MKPPRCRSDCSAERSQCCGPTEGGRSASATPAALREEEKCFFLDTSDFDVSDTMSGSTCACSEVAVCATRTQSECDAKVGVLLKFRKRVTSLYTQIKSFFRISTNRLSVDGELSITFVDLIPRIIKS